MSNVYLCNGTCAEHPFYLENICVSVSSVEELCYVIKENAYLIEPDAMDHRLAEWLGRECGLTDLSGKLEGLLAGKAGMEEFAGAILDYTGYFEPEETRQIKNVLQVNAAMNLYERRKSRADHFLSHKRYVMAIQEYEAVLAKIGDSDPILAGRIYHNLGVCNAGLFAFEQAAECFKKAAAVSAERESYVQYLAAMRLLLKEDEYVAFLAEQKEGYEDSMVLEERVQQAELRWLDQVPADGFAPDEKETSLRLARLQEAYRDYVVGA